MSALIARLKKYMAEKKQLLLDEARFLDGFIHLLFKNINTGEKRTREEKKQLKQGLAHLSSYVPALIIFALPGGMLLLPALAWFLDRRKGKRQK